MCELALTAWEKQIHMALNTVSAHTEPLITIAHCDRSIYFLNEWCCPAAKIHQYHVQPLEVQC